MDYTNHIKYKQNISTSQKTHHLKNLEEIKTLFIFIQRKMGFLASSSFLCFLALVNALPEKENHRDSKNIIQTESDLLREVYLDCLRKDSLSCAKYKLFSLVDNVLETKDTIVVAEGMEIVKTEPSEKDGASRSINGDESVEMLIVNRLKRFLDTHTFKMDVKGSDIVNFIGSTTRSFSYAYDSLIEENKEANDLEEEPRGKKKRMRMMLPFIMMGILKVIVLTKLALAAIAGIAGKALLVGKIALVLSLIIGLKKILSGQKHVTYEVVSHGHDSHDSSGYGGGPSGHGGWGRNYEAQKMAYSAQIPIS